MVGLGGKHRALDEPAVVGFYARHGKSRPSEMFQTAFSFLAEAGDAIYITSVVAKASGT